MNRITFLDGPAAGLWTKVPTNTDVWFMHTDGSPSRYVVDHEAQTASFQPLAAAIPA